MKRIFADVAKFGWHVVAVRPDASTPGGFAFTVGLFETHDHPELVVFGLPADVAHTLLTTCVELIDAGADFQADQVRPDIYEGLTFAVLGVAQIYYEQYLGSAIGFYDSRDFPALQVIWPDKNNRLPWEPEFDPECHGMQPILNTSAV